MDTQQIQAVGQFIRLEQIRNNARRWVMGDRGRNDRPVWLGLRLHQRPLLSMTENCGVDDFSAAQTFERGALEVGALLVLQHLVYHQTRATWT